MYLCVFGWDVGLAEIFEDPLMFFAIHAAGGMWFVPNVLQL